MILILVQVKVKSKENNCYFEGAYTKRFFDLEDVNKYFSIIGDVEAKESQMTRDEEEYSKPKVLYTIKVEKEGIG